MKRINSLLFLAALFVFASVSTMAQAFSTTSVENTPLVGTLPSFCGGESVDFAGNLRTVLHFTRSDSGKVSARYGGTISVRAVGQITGAEYIARETWSFGDRYDSNEPAPYNSSATDNGTLIGLGGVPNLRFHVLLQNTANANGEITASRTTFTLVCGP